MRRSPRMALQSKRSRIAALSPGRLGIGWSGIGWHGIRRRRDQRWRGIMNPLDSITGTIVSGVILALLLAALF